MFFGCCCFLWLYAHVLEARGQIQMAFLRRHLPCILKQDWFLRLAASPLDQAAWPENPREPPAWLPGIVFHRIRFVYMGSGHLNQVLSLQGKLFYKHSVFSWCLRIDLCALQRYLYSFSFYLQALMLLKWVTNFIVEYLPNRARFYVSGMSVCGMNFLAFHIRRPVFIYVFVRDKYW